MRVLSFEEASQYADVLDKRMNDYLRAYHFLRKEENDVVWDTAYAFVHILLTRFFLDLRVWSKLHACILALTEAVFPREIASCAWRLKKKREKVRYASGEDVSITIEEVETCIREIASLREDPVFQKHAREILRTILGDF